LVAQTPIFGFAMPARTSTACRAQSRTRRGRARPSQSHPEGRYAW
jgi:hypothetical protein